MIILLPGPPIPKMRHRSFLRHGRIHTFDLQDSEKKHVKWMMEGQCRLHHWNGIMDVRHVQMEFYMPAPNLSRRLKSILLWKDEPMVKPDIDNLAKFYLDAGNGVLWSDDKQIISLTLSKRYSEKPKTVIRLEVMKPMEIDEQAESILALFTPERYFELIGDFIDMAKNPYPGGDILPSSSGTDIQKRALLAAVLISRLADKYSQDLSKVAKKHPGYWENKKSNIPAQEKA